MPGRTCFLLHPLGDLGEIAGVAEVFVNACKADVGDMVECLQAGHYRLTDFHRADFVTSGIRLGTPAGTTRGFGEAEFREIGGYIAEVVEGLRKNGEAGDAQVEQSVGRRVKELCDRFPIYPDL